MDSITRTQEGILKLLLDEPDSRFSIRGIARGLSKSYTLVYHNVQDLCKRGVLVKESLPPAQMISLNEQAPLNVVIDVERKRREAFFEKHRWIALYMKDVLRTAGTPFFVLLVFGSYAKGTQAKDSDLDVLVIASKNDALETVARQYTRVKKNVIIVDVQDFLEMVRNPNVLNVGNEARKHHIILYNAETYYQILQGLK